MRRVSLLGLVAISVAALTACAPPAAPIGEPTTPPTSTVIEPPTPKPQLVPKRVVIEATNVQLFGDDGELAKAFTYFDATATVVTLLTDQFGSEPVITTTPGSCCEEFPATHYAWDGFLLYDSERQVQEPDSPEFTIRVRTAMVGEVIIETVDGIAVGDSSAEVDASHPGSAERGTTNSGDYEMFRVGDVDFGSSEELGLYELVISVSVVSDHPGGTIEGIYAPSSNGGV